MKKKYVSVIGAGVLALFTWGTAGAGAIDPYLAAAVETLAPGDEVSVIVTLADQVDVKNIKNRDKNKGRASLRARIVSALKDKADRGQKPLRTYLERKKIKNLTSFWIFNGMAFTAPVKVINEMAGSPLVERVSLDGRIAAPEPVSEASGVPEWNLDAIGAPEFWFSTRTSGEGAVVAVMDTGVDAAHLDLGPRWRGGGNSWYDPNGEHAAPYDRNGHGTRVAGAVVGGDATGTAIGVAPGARWIAVKMYNDAGTASHSAIHAGFQWLLDPDGDPSTNDAPDVVNASWGFAGLADQCYTEFQADIQALKAAEIAVVFSAGNSGYANASESPANYADSFAVGAVDRNLELAYFSSGGPSACDGSIYPEVTAPGVGVKTTDLTLGGFDPTASISVGGTSIAAAHVSGAIALLMSAYPEASVAAVESVLKASALDLGFSGPDNDYGYGLLDLPAAADLLASPDPCTPEIKNDGIDQDCNGYDLTIMINLAYYGPRLDFLAVTATSALGRDAALELVGYGPMRWNPIKARWQLVVRRTGGDPGTVTVAGVEGEETARTN